MIGDVKEIHSCSTTLSARIYGPCTKEPYLIPTEVGSRLYKIGKARDEIISQKNLVFDETTIRSAKTRNYMILRNHVTIEKSASADYLFATNCNSLNFVNSTSSMELFNCSAAKISSSGKVNLLQCAEIGKLETSHTVKVVKSICANIFCVGWVDIQESKITNLVKSKSRIELTDCPYINKAFAGFNILASGCNIDTLEAQLAIELIDSQCAKVICKERIEIKDSYVTNMKLGLFAKSTIINSSVDFISVDSAFFRQKEDKENKIKGVANLLLKSSNVNRSIHVDHCEKEVHITLEDSRINVIEFKHFGKVFLRGDSQIEGDVINGEIIKHNCS
jgi:hypothetical protein